MLSSTYKYLKANSGIYIIKGYTDLETNFQEHSKVYWNQSINAGNSYLSFMFCRFNVSISQKFHQLVKILVKLSVYRKKFSENNSKMFNLRSFCTTTMTVF